MPSGLSHLSQFWHVRLPGSFDGLLAYGGDELFAIVLQEAKALPDCVLGQH